MLNNRGTWPNLPVCDVLDELVSALAAHKKAVLIAPPGAGKTTLVPLALAEASSTGKILILEPRRIAARAAAHRMAALMGSKLGDQVGYRMRMDTKVSAQTRVEVVTEGVFTRLVLNDPELSGVSCIIFDEFHERSLDADFGLALALETQAAFREDLQILVMSATLDGARVSELLGAGTPVIESSGRAFPVDIQYRPHIATERIEDAVAAAVRQAVRELDGSVLVFLPGRTEIERAAVKLADIASDTMRIIPLFGMMDMRDQTRAIAPPSKRHRKIVLSTAIAQTSITIDGVNIVIDSGLSREPVFDLKSETTRLETVRVSKANADQRAGRAGRTGPGVAIRLWHEGQNAALRPFDPPEIFQTDLTQYVLSSALWGASSLSELPLLDPPPAPTLAQATEKLRALGALYDGGQITEAGKQIASIPLPVELASMVLAAGSVEDALSRAELALVIVDVASQSRDVDIEAIYRDYKIGQLGKLGHAIANRAMRIVETLKLPNSETDNFSVGRALLDAYALRFAKRRSNQDSTFLMANGRGAFLDEAEKLASEEWLVVVDTVGKAQQARILTAARVTKSEVEDALANRIESITRLSKSSGCKLTAIEERKIGAIVLSSKSVPAPEGEALELALCSMVEELGVDALNAGEAHLDLISRLQWLQHHHGDPWPSFDADTLKSDVHRWLRPFLAGKTSLEQLTSDELTYALLSRLPPEAQSQVDVLAPTVVELPTGRFAKLQYDVDRPNPVLSVRVQELYGLRTHPSVNAGQTPLFVELLSPANRPIQGTLDLPNFWTGSWADVRKDMRGRYPKHFWPEHPESAEPTTRAKPRT
ncbi:MAG: ATP-dependent helicase HrpB [Pseudomonadota bacterium]